MEAFAMTFEVKTAVREAVPPLIALWGPSGGGKTYSALKVARGLVGSKGKIVLIDTENGRAKFYANMVGGWHHLDLQPGFSPQRYTEAMKAAEAAGADVIIIDSMSHAWDGEGGVLDMADNARSASGKLLTGLAKFKTPKTQFKRMMNNLLRSRVPVIFCLRAKQLSVQAGRGADAEILDKGLTPICEKNFIFEATVSVLLGPDHKPVFQNTEDLKCNPAIPSVKIPEDAVGAIKRGAFLDESTGAAIASWINGGEAIDHDTRELQRKARDKATEGSVKLRDWWENELTKPERQKLVSMLDELKTLAQQADADEADAADNDGTDSDPLADAFTPAKAA
jgi:hypothetical protein